MTSECLANGASKCVCAQGQEGYCNQYRANMSDDLVNEYFVLKRRNKFNIIKK